MEKPAEKLAALILDNLVKEGLLSQPLAKKLLPKLSAGTLRSEDWRLAIETSTQKEPAK